MKFDFIPDDVSKFDNAYDVLKERGFIEQSTDEDKIRELLRNENKRPPSKREGEILYRL